MAIMGATQKTIAYICESCLCNLRPQSRRFNILASAGYSTTPRPRYMPKQSVRNYRQTPFSQRTCSIIPYSVHFPAPQRAYSDHAPTTHNGPQPSGVAPLSHRRLVSLIGADAAKFLHGLVTNNVDPTRFDPFYSAVLDARGRVLWDIFVWPVRNGDEWGCLIEVDVSEAEALSKHLRRHKLRSKIAITATGDGEAASVWAGWDAESRVISSDAMAVLEDPRAADFAYRFLVKERNCPPSDKLPVLDPEQYHLRRYMYGVPEGPAEITRESALPMEANIDLARGIDFKKGCYVGQELTIRTKHTGVVRKRILPVQLYHAGETVPNALQHDPHWVGEIPAGTDIKQLGEDGSVKKGRAAGKFIAGIGNIGLAMCRLEMMTPMRISAEGGSWKPDMEFGLPVPDEENAVRVKAFLPPWLVEREKELWGKGRQKLGIKEAGEQDTIL